MGWDPVWFGVVTIVLLELSALTPPIAGPIYITQLIDTKATTTDVIMGVIPFYIAVFVLLVLLIYFPSIALWLPSGMAG